MDSICESLWWKIIGKPYSGKPNVRFDEGELEIEPSATTPALYSTERGEMGRDVSFSKEHEDFFLKARFDIFSGKA